MRSVAMRSVGMLLGGLLLSGGTFAAPAPVPPSPDGIALAAPQAEATREPSSPQAWGGPRTGNEETLSDRVVAYDITALLDPTAHTIDGRETLRWRNRSDQVVRAVYVHLYLNAFEGRASTFYSENRNLGFQFRSDVPARDGAWGYTDLGSVTQGGVPVAWYYVHPDNGPQTDHTVVRLDLPEAVAPGGTTVLQIAFHDQLPRVVARTGYFGSFHLVGQWFPKIAVLERAGERGAPQLQWNAHEFHAFSEFYADYGSFDVKLTVPQGYTIGATGEELGAPVRAGMLVTHHFAQADVHDFAWTADNRTAPPLEGEYRGPGSPTVKVRVLYPPEYQASAAPTLKAAIDALAYFSRTLGPYPYRTVTAVIPPFNAEEAGGMEYPTFFTSLGYAQVDEGTLDQFMVDFVTIHEFGHGYFYGILGSNEFEEPMLDEGMNEYWDMRMLRERGQRIFLGNRLMSRLGLTPSLASFDLERILAMREDPSDKLGANSWNRTGAAGYGSVYARTATAMHDLEEALGHEAMERAMREYYNRWKFRHPGVADLRECLAEASGQRGLVEAAFARQVYASQKVDDGIDKFTSEEELPQPGTVLESGKRSETTQEQAEQQADSARATWKKSHPDAKDGSGPFAYRTTLVLRRRGAASAQPVVVRFSDNSTETVLWDSTEQWQRFVWVKPVRALSAQIDPDGRHLLDANVLDDSRTIKPDAHASRRWSADLAALIQSAFALLAAL